MADRVDVNENLEPGQAMGRSRALRLAHYFLRLFSFLLIAVATVVVCGFLIFYQHVASMKPPSLPRADAIVVLTGGYQRIDQAVELLTQGAGHRLLISGVNPATTGNHLRLLTRATTGLFECCVDIGHDGYDRQCL